MSELGCADGCGREMGAENCADGCGQCGCNGVAGNGWGEEAAGDERAWLRGRLRTANGWGELRGRLRTAWVHGEWLEMGREKKPLVMSELGCADSCGREMGSENCADSCERRATELLEMGEEKKPLVMSELGWLRGRLWTGNGCGELRRRLRTAWVQGSGWKWAGRRTRCSPRTRMLKRMLMDMQSLRTIFCNSLFEQSCIYIFPLLPVCSVEWTV